MRHNCSGQTLLLVVLSMSVVLTLVLSVLSHSITDIKLTSADEEAQRAFSAAEAGIERALITGSDSGGSLGANSNYTAVVSSFGSGTKTLVYPAALYAGETATFWFVGHNPDGTLICDGTHPCFEGDGNTFKVCWGNAGTAATSATTPALEVTVVYAQTPGHYDSLRIARGVYDPNAGRTAANKFEAATVSPCVVDTATYAFQKTLSFSGLGIPANTYTKSNGLQFLKLRLFYSVDVAHGAGLNVDYGANTVLPSQGTTVVSTGTAGEANRRIQVYWSFGESPEFFSAAAFSLGGIGHN